MNKFLTIFFFMLFFADFDSKSDRFITRQGQISFFSYTSVENIEAKNNQVLSLFDVSNNEIAIDMLMNAFVFKKSLMHEHFNESYIESDIFPKANFTGTVLDFDASNKEAQTKIIRGKLTIHGITKQVDIKATIEQDAGKYIITGDFNVLVKDFDIRIPPILASNIAKNISIMFRFEYNHRYEE